MVNQFTAGWKKEEVHLLSSDKRIGYFRRYGYECLVLWEYELQDKENTVERIKAFMEE